MVKKVGKPFAVFDIDGTLIRWQLYHAVADELVKRGQIDARAYQSVKAARIQWKKRSSPDAFKIYERRLVAAYEKMLLKLSVSHFYQAVDAVFDQYKDQVYIYTRQLIKDLKVKGYLLFAISASQTEIVGRIADYYGFDDYVGTDYLHDDKKFTGAATIPIGNKHVILAKLVKKHRAGQEGSIAVGDSTNDISMLEAVDKPIVFNPERKLFDHAKRQGWKIVIERKNVIYELKPENEKYLLA